jgi:hypothetical protein
MLMKSALFCVITQRRMVILYWRFGITYQSHLQGSVSRWSTNISTLSYHWRHYDS